MSNISKAHKAGYECLVAWADLLDQINVFPVADGDTGSNLRVSLAPLRNDGATRELVITQLAQGAHGNSGNIAAAFLTKFCQADSASKLAGRAEAGRVQAWQALATPKPGTMLTIFDCLAQALAKPSEQVDYQGIIDTLQQAVLSTSESLPALQQAGVVDAGALAMYIFFTGFFNELGGNRQAELPLFAQFKDRLTISSSFHPPASKSYCVDLLIKPEDGQQEQGLNNHLAELGDSVVVVKDDQQLKVHIHTPDPEHLRQQLAAMGEVSKWSHERIRQTAVSLAAEKQAPTPIHLLTDCAASLPAELAQQNNITVLDSYIMAQGTCQPASLFSAAKVYELLRHDQKVTTSQASNFERHNHYHNSCQQFGPSLYLCVGSTFTGNYDIAAAWQKKQTEKEFQVIDTGASSGKLALIVLQTARFARTTSNQEDILAFANKTCHECGEYVFIDQLKYLVAGGRVSRVGGFWGDLLHLKPIITPTHEGVKKAGVVRSSKAQLARIVALFC